MATCSDHSSSNSAANQSTTATIVSASLNSTADHSGTGNATQFDMVTTVTVDHTTNRVTNNASSVTGMTMDTFKDTTHYPNEHLRTMAVDAATTTILLANATQNDADIGPYSPHLNTENSTTNQKSSSSSTVSSLNELLTVTLHLSSASTVATEPDINTATINSSSTLQQPQRTDLVRVILIPISGLEQRESEMIQTARALQIPSTRWNGSLLYNLYHQQRQQMVAVEGGNDTIGERISSSSSGRITLHLYQDSDLKWSITNNSHTEQILDWNTPDTSTTAATTVGLSSSLPPSSSSSIWFGTSLNKNIDVDWIQAYYVTGRISIPSNARGYDVLWLLEYFQLMYQPDQFHFANYATYTRVQLWSKYYCYLRPKLIDWILQEINQQQKQQRSQSDDHQGSMFPLLFGTMSSNETSIELGTDRLLPLGDITEPISTIKSNVSNGSSKRTLADRALKLFNTSYIETTRNHVTGHQQQHKHYSGTKSCTDEAQSQTTVPCPEELTATEIRNDFCRLLKHRLCENSSADNTNVTWNVQFTVRPVTLHYNVENEIIPEDTMNSNSSNSSTPLTNGSVVHSDSAGTNNTNKHIKIVVHQRYLVAHRAVLVIDAHPQQVNESKQQRLPSIKVSRSKSDLSAPVDELVEEEIAKGRLEELLQQVEARGEQFTDKQDRRVTINETLSFEKEKSVRSNDESKSFDTPILATAMSNQKSFDMLDLNAPDDELNASLDNGNSSFNASIGIFPISTMKKKKKPKPVFVLPDKLLDVDNTESPQLARMKLPIVKSSPIIGSKPNDALALPGPITIVRKGTFDNTVTSALTGPFYIDENGVLRDVFDNCDPDSDEDFEGDEDTRAQARRHEWIQTALLNRGIGERMETLLKEDREPNTNATTTSFDPWDWISGLNVCELSREVMKSVEQYASCVLCESSGVVKQTSTTNEGAATTNMSATIFPLLSKEKVTANPVILKHEETMRSSETEPLRDNIRPHMKSLQDDQSREDEHFEHIVENIVFTTDLDSREGSFGSHGTKESPRGVQRFDSASSADKVSTEPIGSEQTDARTSLLGKADVAAPKPNNEKKIRGIKSLFRRKRVDSTGI